MDGIAEPASARCLTLNKARIPSLQLRQQTHPPTCTQPTRGARTNPGRATATRHLNTHLQHLPPIPHPGDPPPWVPTGVIYNDTGRAYHYPQPLRNMAHIRGSHADNTLMTRFQQELQTTLYYLALDPSLLPVDLQNRRARLLHKQLPLLDRVARWCSRRDVDIPTEYTICPCHMQRLHEMPTGPGRCPTGHMESRGHDHATRPMGPGGPPGQQGTTPDAATGD